MLIPFLSRRYLPTLCIVALFAVASVGFLSDRTQYQREHADHNYQKSNGSINDYSSAFLAIGTWAETNHNAIEALSAIGVLIFTVGLFAVTGVLAVATAHLATATASLRDAEKDQAVELSKATDLAEKQFLLSGRQADIAERQHGLARHQFFVLHRPRIRVAYIRIGPLQAGLHATAEIWAINVGDSDAQITEIGSDIFPRRIGMSGLAMFGAVPQPYPGIALVTPGQQANLQVRGGVPMTQQIIDGIHGGQAGEVEIWQRTIELCAVGTIHYLDQNGTRRITSFFRIYDANRMRFMRAPEDDEYAEWDYEA